MTNQAHQKHEPEHDRHKKHERAMYVRFAAMVLTAMVVMYWTMFAGTYEWSHIEWSESRLFMTLTMGGAMGVVMLAWMLNMYRDTKWNLVIAVASLMLLVAGISLDRSQATVQDRSFMRAMIPHHSLAITRAERSHLSDLRVCQLAVKISEAQRREILEMEWLIDDIAESGEVETAEEARDRPVPDFDRAAKRKCPAQ